jgi:hypothetical protein
MQKYYEYLLQGKRYKPAQIHKDTFQREIVEALLISEAQPKDIKSAFGIPEQVLKDYSELFFDLSKLETHLDKLSYVTNYHDRFGKELKIRALNLGPDFIYFKYANIIPQTQAQRDLVKKMFLSSAYRAMESNYTSMTTDVSKSAIEYAKIMLKAYDSIEKLMKEDTPGDMNAIKVILTRDSELRSVLDIAEEDIV